MQVASFPIAMPLLGSFWVLGETQELAGKILKELFVHQRQGALVLALSGELGAGKTAFTQGLGKALGVKEKILSPTFVLMKNYWLLIRLLHLQRLP